MLNNQIKPLGPVPELNEVHIHTATKIVAQMG